MDFYEDEKFESVMEEITDKMGYLILDVILMSLKKINRENQIFKEILETKLEVYMENHPEF
ncbi:MAG: hypothetical protein EHJ94_10110 [Deltaproteobacteria bacterium]|nr:MAG: hypothetical protein EHJ94_10110 [Deltaproteobacteria bacterium]